MYPVNDIMQAKLANIFDISVAVEIDVLYTITCKMR